MTEAAASDPPALVGVEEQYRLLLESVTDFAIFLLDKEGRVATWNAGAERIFGYQPEEIIGQPVDILFTPEDRERGAPPQVLRTAAEKGRTSDERWHVRKGGTRLWVNGSATALRDERGDLHGFAKVCRDLTSQKQAEDEHRRLAAVVESSEDAIIAKNLDGIITDWNPAATRLYGWSAQEAIGQPISLLIPTERPNELPNLIERLKRGERVEHYETERMRKDGSRVAVAVTISPIRDAAGRVVGASGIGRDISERKRLQEELRQRAEQLAEADRRKNDFLAQLGHELRNPLAPIQNALQVMQLRGPDRREAVKWAQDMMQRQVKHLVRLVDDLLDVSRITCGKMTLNLEPVELASVVGHAVELARPLIDSRKQHLAISLTPTLRLEADPIRLAQVIGNLLTNAAKYTPEGGRIWLTGAREQDEAVLRVRDNGIGIPRGLLPRIFDLFVQSERDLRQSQGGLGIGLALVKGLVEIHGGTVIASSDGASQGSEFVVRLPIGPTRQGIRAASDAPRENKTLSPPRRVLVVDDNVDAAETVAMFLRLKGHEVRTIHEGAAVLEAAAAFRPEIVLLDIGLPGDLSGYDLAPRLRELSGLEHAFLVALTGYGQEEDKKRSRESGFDAHLTKPADLDDLQALLAEERKD